MLAYDVAILYLESSFLTVHASQPLVKGNEGTWYQGDDVHFILIPRDQVPFGQHQESQPLGGSNFRSMRRVIISYSQPITFVRVDPEHAQSDRKSEFRRGYRSRINILQLLQL